MAELRKAVEEEKLSDWVYGIIARYVGAYGPWGLRSWAGKEPTLAQVLASTHAAWFRAEVERGREPEAVFPIPPGLADE
jgi:hypothetical protein